MRLPRFKIHQIGSSQHAIRASENEQLKSLNVNLEQPDRAFRQKRVKGAERHLEPGFSDPVLIVAAATAELNNSFMVASSGMNYGHVPDVVQFHVAAEVLNRFGMGLNRKHSARFPNDPGRGQAECADVSANVDKNIARPKVPGQHFFIVPKEIPVAPHRDRDGAGIKTQPVASRSFHCQHG
jgi:hypothetical protein